MKILFICLSGAGDVLMSTALVREIRLAFPKARIDFLVMQGKISRDIINNNKDINNIIYFNFIKEGYVKSLLFCNKLRKENYDISISTYPQARYHYSVVARLIGAKKRIGYNYETQKMRFNTLLFTDTLEEDDSKHVVENNLEVLRVLGIKQKSNPQLILNLAEEDIEFGKEYFNKNKIKKAIIIHPGSGTTKNFILKRWDKDKFAELCRLISKRKFQIILTGGPDEEELKNHIIKKSELKLGEQIFNLKGDNLNKEAGVMKLGKLMICNDAVMGHIAAALGLEIVVLFGPTRAENVGPFSEKKHIISKNQGVDLWKHGSRGINLSQAETMKKIQVKDVYEVVDKILK